MLTVGRKAILIGDPGPKGRRLPGVALDISNMHGYLLSPRGNGWRREEIIVLWGKTKAEILSAVHGLEADYLLVYYSGHGSGELGYVRRGGGWVFGNKRRLELSTGEYIEDVDLINERVLRQLVICDSCRTRPPAQIGGIPETLEGIPYTEAEVVMAGRWFERYVRLSPPGCAIVHSTLDGHSAMDSSEGGRFTLALLEGCLNWRGRGGYAPIGLEELLDYAAEVLGTGKHRQIPEIVYRTGDLRVPFGLEAPWPGQVADVSVPLGDDRGLRPVNGWLALGGIALVAWMLSRGD